MKIHSFECIFYFLYFLYIFLQIHFVVYNYDVKRNKQIVNKGEN